MIPTSAWSLRGQTVFDSVIVYLPRGSHVTILKGYIVGCGIASLILNSLTGGFELEFFAAVFIGAFLLAPGGPFSHVIGFVSLVVSAIALPILIRRGIRDNNPRLVSLSIILVTIFLAAVGGYSGFITFLGRLS